MKKRIGGEVDVESPNPLCLDAVAEEGHSSQPRLVHEVLLDKAVVVESVTEVGVALVTLAHHESEVSWNVDVHQDVEVFKGLAGRHGGV